MAGIPFSRFRVVLLKMYGVKLERGCYIGFNVICDTNFSHLITIGDRVTISHNTLIFTHTATPAKNRLARFQPPHRRRLHISADTSGNSAGVRCGGERISDTPRRLRPSRGEGATANQLSASGGAVSIP